MDPEQQPPQVTDNQIQELVPEPPRPKHFLFTVTILLLVTAVFALWFFFIQQPVEEPTIESYVKADPTADWQTYRNEEYGFEVRYPTNLSVSQSGDKLLISHTVPYEYVDACDAKDGSRNLDEVIDFNASMKVLNLNFQEAVEASYWSPADIIENNTPKFSTGFVERYNVGDLDGFKVRVGAEGCGMEMYYLQVGDDVTLVVERKFDPTRTPEFSRYAEVVSLPNIISATEEMIIFEQILSTFRFIDDTLGWQTYRNEEYGYEFKYPAKYFLQAENASIDFSVGSPNLTLERYPKKGREGGDFISIKISSNPSQLSIQDWLNKSGYKDYRSVQVDDVDGVTFSLSYGGIYDGAKANETIFGKDALIFNFWAGRFFSEDKELEQDAEKILSTFKFIDEAPTTDNDDTGNTDHQITTFNSGIVGRVTIGPTCPVAKNPPDPDCADKPYQATLRVKSEAGKIVVEEKVGADGTFKFNLPPGDYIIEDATGSQIPWLKAVSVTVNPEKYSEVNLSFDSGIR